MFFKEDFNGKLFRTLSITLNSGLWGHFLGIIVIKCEHGQMCSVQTQMHALICVMPVSRLISQNCGAASSGWTQTLP